MNPVETQVKPQQNKTKPCVYILWGLLITNISRQSKIISARYVTAWLRDVFIPRWCGKREANTMAADAMAPCVAMTSRAMLLTMQDRQNHTFHEEGVLATCVS